MGIGQFIEGEKLTEAGRALAEKLYRFQCDEQVCYECQKRNSATGGPGGPDCPAGKNLASQWEVTKILHAFLTPRTQRSGHY